MLSTEGGRTSILWKNSFVIVQGHQFLWWNSVLDFDEAIPPAGRVLLAGHAGLATPSPLELREVKKEEIERMVCLFGRGIEKQQRVTMLTPSADLKFELEQAIENALLSKMD
jgi:hypothetical protein